MKKKLLLAIAMIAMLVCILAISVSAATLYKDADGNTLFSYVDENNDYDFDSYEGSFPKTDSEGNALTWYITATATEGSDTVHTVASLKTLGEAGNINGNGAYSFTSPVTNKNTVSVNFPDNAGIKTLAFKSFGGYGSRANNNILFVYCPNTLTAFENNPFQETQAIVVELDDETPITSIPQNFAHEARNLEAINIPSSVTVINGNGKQNGAPFYNGYSLKSVTFASMDNLTVMKNSVFAGCTSLQTIKLPNSVTEIGNYCFSNCASLKEISLPNSLKTIANHAFAWCTSLEVIKMGSSFAYFNNTGDNSFTYSAGSIKEIYIPKSFYATTPDVTNNYKVSYAFHGVSADCKFFYCGTAAEFEIAKANFLTQKSATSNNGRFINATVISYADYLADPDGYATGNYVICGYSTCDAFFNGIHTEKTDDSNPCWLTECGLCGVKDVYSGNESTHNLTTEMIYENYLANGVKKSYCTNENCTHPVNEESIAPLFEFKGYSSNNDGEMCVTYNINTVAIKEYTDFYGEALTFSYGIVVAANNTNPYALSEKVVKVDLSSNEYTAVDFRLKGLGESTKDLAIAMNMYVVETKGESTTVYYLTSEGTSKTAELITYETTPKEDTQA